MRAFRLFVLLAVVVGLQARAPKKYPYEHRPMDIIVVSYNNEKYVEANLNSIFAQEYDATKFRVVYVDDCSTDKTGDLVLDYKRKKGLDDTRLFYIKNTRRRGAIYNRFIAAHKCESHHILLFIDGDDWLSRPDVLLIINEMYQRFPIWLTYGNHVASTGGPGNCTQLPQEVVNAGTIRNHPIWCTSHLHSCYAWLFQEIHLKDFMVNAGPYKGLFYPAATDIAFTFPRFEMAGERVMFIKPVLYIYNVHNALNVGKQKINLQRECLADIRTKKPYKRLAATPVRKAPKATVVLVLDQRETAASIIASCAKIQDLTHVTMLFDQDMLTEQELNQQLPVGVSASFVPFSSLRKTLTSVLSSTVDQARAFLLLITKPLELRKTVLLTDCLAQMRSTHAHGFYLMPLKPDTMPSEQLEGTVFCWQYGSSCSASAQLVASYSGVVYQKQWVKGVLHRLPSRIGSVRGLEQAWNNYCSKRNQLLHEEIGLFYAS